MIYELLKDRIINGGSGSEAIIKSLSISANGVYTASSGVDGYSPITVNVPQKEPNIQSLSISANGTYNAPADIDGYNPITVAVPERVPVVESKEIIENGTYTPAEGVDGFNSVVVNVPQKEPNIQNLSVSANGTYTAPSGTDGYSPVVVDVQPDLENITITANGTYSHAGKDGYDQVVVNVPGGGTDITDITFHGNPSGLFQNNQWDVLLPEFRTIHFDPYSSESWDLHSLFSRENNLNVNYKTDLSYLIFDMSRVSINDMGSNGLGFMFRNQENLTALPTFDWSKTNKSAPRASYIQLSGIFYNCEKLRNIPNNFLDIPINRKDFLFTNAKQMFEGCKSLRNIPNLSMLNNQNWNNGSSVFYVKAFNKCYVVDEITNIPVNTTHTWVEGNHFNTTFASCMRAKEITFATSNGTPYNVYWKNQTIDLTNVGQAAGFETYITDYNSGITADKAVSDYSSYELLKNDPDWFASNISFSRYNHTSAVNTINSLPNCVNPDGTNIIKFSGQHGSLTDGGAINTLTAEEIAVATAKGWTVSFA